MRFSTFLFGASLILAASPVSSQMGEEATYVANQGGFGANTSSLTALYSVGEEATQLFAGQFGSTVQSVTRIGSRLYVMSDEAARIDVIDTATNGRVAQISSPDVNSVRYMAEVGPNKAYVTQLYLPDGTFSGGSVAVVNLQTNQFTGVINDASFSNPEGIAVVDGFAFVANSGFGSGTTLTVIETTTDTVVRVDEIGCSARAVLPDEAEGEVYAFCENEVVVVSVAVPLAADGPMDPVVARIPVPESIRPLGTSGLGQDAAQANVRNEGLQPEMVAAGTGGVLALNPDSDEVRVIPITGERAISAIGLSTIYGGDFIDRVIVLGRPDTDSPFGSSGVVTTHSLFGGELRATVPAGIYPTSVAAGDIFMTSAEPGAGTEPFALTGVYPNPASGPAVAAFTLAQAAAVHVSVFDVLGREVLASEGAFGPGEQAIDLDAAALRPGLYVVRLEADGHAATARFTVAR